ERTQCPCPSGPALRRPGLSRVGAVGSDCQLPAVCSRPRIEWAPGQACGGDPMGVQRSLGPPLTGLSVGLLALFSGVAPVQPADLAALAHHPHLCQTTRGADGRRHPGFFCPRLSDAREAAYCCRLRAAAGSCCTRDEFEALYGMNLSALPPPPIFRGPGPLLALGLYSLLLVALMTADLVHFCRGRGRGRGRGRSRSPGRGPGQRLDRRRHRPPARSSAARPLQVWAGGGAAAGRFRAGSHHPRPRDCACARRTPARDDRECRGDPRVRARPPCPAARPLSRGPGLCPRVPHASAAERLRQEGNELFRCGDYEGALSAYAQALGLGAPQDQAVLHRNLAACHLKLEDYDQAEKEASRAIEKDGGDVKALYRRSQALGKLGRLDQAVLDLQRCVSLEPKNKVFQEALRSIGGQIQEKVRYMSSTDAKVEQMFQILLDPQEKGTEKKQKASQNLVVLAREDAGAEKIFRSNGVQLLQRLLDTGEPDLMLAALRTLVGVCSEHQSRTVATLSVLGTRRVVSILGADSAAVSLAACRLLQVALDALKDGVRKGFRGTEGAVVVGELLGAAGAGGRCSDGLARGGPDRAGLGWAEALGQGAPTGVGSDGRLLADPARELKVLVSSLLELLTAAGVPGQGRDNALSLLIKAVPRKSPKDPDNSLTLWVIDQGLRKILEVGGSLQDPAGGLSVTANSRMSAAILLSKLFDDLKCDAERENFHRLCESHIRRSAKGLGAGEAASARGGRPSLLLPRGVDASPCGAGVGPSAPGCVTAPPVPRRSWFEGRGLAGKLQAIQTVSCLLQGPCEAGNRALELSGVMESVIALCASRQEEQQLVAVEALIHAAGKAKRASFITANGVSLLKDLYKRSEKDSIRIRALVGLCKLGSAGGTDFSMKQFAEGSTLKLAKQCRKWLCNDQIDAGTRRWAVEGLAYLTFDADVKEEFVEDAAALKALFQLSRSEERSVLFAVASALVNCTNSYDYEEPDPKMVELAKYAKQHVPELHPKDQPAFVRARVKKLLAAGVVSALTCMVKTESPVLTSSCRELLSRVFLALVEDVEERGTVVAQGGGKALLPLALEGTDVGQTKAAQALAKLTITSNPEMTFPGERIFEVVRPLVSLLHLNCSGLQNFEALMALTNLAGTSERLRQKILKEKAVPMIEGYMFEEHEMIRRAATECMSNLALSAEVQDLFEAPGNDRLKLLVLYSGEDDELLRRAAAGGLAVLTAARPSLCSRVPQVTTHWLEILQALMLSPSQELQHRGVVVVLNMVEASREVAGTLMQSEVLEILSVLAKGEDGPVARAATACLGRAVEYGLIKPRQDGQ
ncbi:Protein unc-45A, partial [Galemys pyrenaicus]